MDAIQMMVPLCLGLSGVRKWLDEILGEKTFDDLQIPCAVTAVDVKTGSEVIITEGRFERCHACHDCIAWNFSAASFE